MHHLYLQEINKLMTDSCVFASYASLCRAGTKPCTSLQNTVSVGCTWMEV